MAYTFHKPVGMNKDYVEYLADEIEKNPKAIEDIDLQLYPKLKNVVKHAKRLLLLR